MAASRYQAQKNLAPSIDQMLVQELVYRHKKQLSHPNLNNSALNETATKELAKILQRKKGNQSNDEICKSINS
jgi:glutaredoxin 2